MRDIGRSVVVVGLFGAFGCGDAVEVMAAGTTAGTGESTGSSTGVPTSGGDGGSSDVGEVGTTGDGGCPPGWADDLALGPEPVMLAEGLAVPIDVVGVTGQFVIDVAGEATAVAAQLRFRVGAEAGRPIFDLRQEPLAGDLDGDAVTAADVWTRDLGGGVGQEMRVLDREVAACSEHVLNFDYVLVRPPGFAADPPEFDEDGVVWDFAFNDVAPRMFLEQWLPANLIHDRHTIGLVLEIEGGQMDQRVISNGAITRVDAARWEIAFPARSTALSPMLVLRPGNAVLSGSAMVDGVEIEVHAAPDVDETPAQLLKIATGAFAEFTASTGAYIHPRFTAFVTTNAGMEYDGGTTSDVGSLRHELFHSWYGRGVSPRRGSDGWIDEAWNEWNTGVPVFPAGGMNFADPPVVLCKDDAWSRTTPLAAYDVGKAVFAGIAAEVGVEALRGGMREFYAVHAGGSVTTELLERHLHCTLQASTVRALFHRFVYGRKDPPPATPADYCG